MQTKPSPPTPSHQDALEDDWRVLRGDLTPRSELDAGPVAPGQGIPLRPQRPARGPTRRSIERLWDNYNFLSECAARARYVATLPVVQAEKPRAGVIGQVRMTLGQGDYGYTPFMFVFGHIGEWLPLALGAFQTRLADVSFEPRSLPQALRSPESVAVEVYVRGNRVLHAGLLLHERRQVVSMLSLDVLVSEPRRLWRGKGYRCLYFVSRRLV
jgi:hypothetical protein